MVPQQPTSSTSVTTAPAAAPLVTDVFGRFAERLESRRDDLALFAATNRDFEGWCLWEAVAAFRDAGWTVRPRPPYGELGVPGSREEADLLVFDPETGGRVLVEISLVHDWRSNKWIDQLDGDTDRLRRPLTAGVHPLQVIVATALESPITVNDLWKRWLAMSKVWTTRTPLEHATRLGPSGQMVVRGWGASGLTA